MLTGTSFKVVPKNPSGETIFVLWGQSQVANHRAGQVVITAAQIEMD